MSSPLIKKYGDQSRWLNWKLETINSKQTKIPYYSKTKKASSTDSDTWKLYDECAIAFDNGSNNFSGVGIVLHDSKLICIDIDHVVENGKVIGEHSETILKLLKKANTFTEISQSGTGLHLFLETTEEFKPIANKKAPFEVYSNGRYIATTDNSYDKTPKEVRTVTVEEIESILKIIGYPFGKVIEPEITLLGETIEQLQKPMSDEELIQRMFHSKNGEEIEKLYNGNTSKYDNDESKADSGLLAHLAFWSRKDPIQMETIWLNSPLGKRDKTQKRKDYRDRSIQNAILKCKQVYIKPVIETGDFLVVTKRDGDVVIPCQENVLIALRTNEQTKGKFRYNIWLDRKETLLESNEWRPVRDNDYNLIKSILATSYTHLALITASPTFITSAVLQYCEENSVDPAVDYFSSLVWDKKPRLDKWIETTFNTIGNEKEYAIIGRQWLKALIKRVVHAGCKFDNVLVLEGEQGIGKSTALRVLGRNYHVELTTSPNDKDFFMLLIGHTIVEFSEGEIQERSSMKLLKSIITTQVDTYRSPYGRETEQHPRRCVFAMTTNDSKYLKDETGNRRWLPVACVGKANIEWLEENREQLYAEAYHCVVNLKEDIYEGLSSEEIREMQEDRRLQRFEEEAIIDWYNNLSYTRKLEGVGLQEVFNGALKNDGASFNQLHNTIIPPILKNILKLEQKRKTIDGKLNRVYIPSDKTWKVVQKGEKDLFNELTNEKDITDDGKPF